MFFESAAKEFFVAFARPHLWGLLAWYDIKQRYRRSVLGPFWLTISTGVLIATLGLLWSTLFKTDLHEYLPYFAAGNVVWSFVSMQLNEATTGFTQFEHLIKQSRLPYPSYILRLLCRNLIIFLHNFLIVIIVVSFVGDGWSLVSLVAIPGMLLLSAIVFFVSLACALVCTRYRDMVPVVQNLVTVGYFLTPIMWDAQRLPEQHRWVAAWNPLSHVIDVVRAPLLGHLPSVLNWLVSLAALAISAAISWGLFARTHQRVAYWI
ncbi:ABC-2 type transporter [Pigmentiphaga humi]|uniref:ABC-2 type transporter n=1 Tax=Pigmentiphaga humi TaxID=2478468 RepID=A0A3P4B1E4_9BURK|nr:ABC transporter permease [Pigmentiphaga humi]VCU69468.1 ABC-2 type transporter [Pigmentiphaga humi]